MLLMRGIIRQRHAIGAVAVAVLLLPFLGASVAHACSCEEYVADPVKALMRSTLVFVGEVSAAEPIFVPATINTAEGERLVPSSVTREKSRVSFRALREWKGRHSSTYVVIAGITISEADTVVADCEVHFELGKKYLVFAAGQPLSVDYCMPTTELGKATELIAALERYLPRGTKQRK